MGFVHCNICYKKHDQSQLLSFFVTNCGHLYCENCTQKDKSTIQCKICKKNATIIKLDKNIPENIQDFFSDPSTWDTKAKMIRDFQQKQTAHRLNYLEIKLNHYNQLKLDYQKLLAEIQKKNNVIKQLQDKINRSSSNTPNKSAKLSPMPDLFNKYPSPAFSMRSGNTGSALTNKNLPRQSSPFGIMRQHQPVLQMKATRTEAPTDINSFRLPQQYPSQSSTMNATMNATLNDPLSQKYNPLSFLARWSGLRPN